MTRTNEHGQPIGPALDGWTPPPHPRATALTGRHVKIVPTDVGAHAPALFDAFDEPADWTYLFQGPFDDRSGFTSWMHATCVGDDPLFHTIMVENRPVGLAAYLRIAPAAGSIEIGSIHFAPALQRTAAATEAMFLLMQRAFDLGYRRYEWKCDALNAPSRAAAHRLGFTYEGTFRQAITYKGRSRDTAWFSIIDGEWPSIHAEFIRWLDPSNFDANGTQLTALSVPRDDVEDDLVAGPQSSVTPS
jgi:RimJ/RimL family protein N-acetyltransferase